MNHETYKDYFNISPKFHSSVTDELIKSGKVKWSSFYPHDTFVKLLEKIHIMLSGKDSRSLWVEGAYGTGKSYAALTIKSLLASSDDDMRIYFEDYGLSKDLCQQLITDKNNGKLITIHRIGSASIHSDQDLILAVQDSITLALQQHNIVNRGESALKDAALNWFNEKEANRTYFDSLIQEEKYIWEFGGKHIDEVIDVLKNGSEIAAFKLMRNILRVAEDNGITALRLDIPALCEWIKSIIDKNDISAILFVWDEFSEYFTNNLNALTGFQSLAEISQSHPFYFLIVTHESQSLIEDKDKRKKILDRFVGGGTVRIEMPENMAFRLMAKAMKITSDPVLLPKWQKYKAELNYDLTDVRDNITSHAKKNATMGQKTVISDEELQNIVPIHPYAALLLKHMSVAFNSNARSMFDFIISNDMTEAKGFKWFISNYGPLDNLNLLTVDMLWDFFNGKDQTGLNDDVRVILDSFGLLKAGSLTPDQVRVFKTILLLEAISVRVNNVELLRPNEQNIDLAFLGTDWTKGKARNIAAGLCQQGLLFEKPVGNGMKEYTVANNGGNKAKIEQYKEEIRKGTRTLDLVVSADLLSALQLTESIRGRYIMDAVSSVNFTQASNKFNSVNKPNRFKVLVTFALNDNESAKLKELNNKAIMQSDNELYYIECLTQMGNDLYEQYVENMAYSKNYAQNDKQRAVGFENQARKCLIEWQQKIVNGAFMLYTPDNKSGIRLANFQALQEELQKINRQKYPYSPEQYNLTSTMFTKGPLAQGAECGINQELKQSFKSSNVNTSLSTALAGAWQVEKYWEDSTKQSLPIVHIKNEVERLVRDGFNKGSGRVSVLSIFEALEQPKYGFMPNNVAAFILGFVLKEYATADYYWSNGSNSDVMSPDKMKAMIANAINQKVSPSSKYKEEFIVAMSVEQRAFLQCTASVFQIPTTQCDSVERARDQIRIKMKGLMFPIWCLKFILDSQTLKSSKDYISNIIDAYCGIANTANGYKNTESELAEDIGKLVCEHPSITQDLVNLFTSENCRKGMLAYIDIFQGGILPKLAAEINDNGVYLDEVKRKFNADAANWVWSSDTADEKISDVILEYHIIAESNKSLPIKSNNLNDIVREWNKRTDNIKMPYDELHKYAGDFSGFLKQLYYIKQSGQIQEQNKPKFYELLLTQREKFDCFYKEQLPYFKQLAKGFIDDLDEETITDFYTKLPSGQFTKSISEYYQFLENQLDSYKKGLIKERLKALWLDKTYTKDPEDWSERYETPILCMFDDSERGEAKTIFDIVLAYSSSDADLQKAMDYLKRATFYERLNDPTERDCCFNERVIGEYSVMLKSVDEVRKNLLSYVPDKPYNWMDNSAVQNRLRMLAEKQYKLNGYEQAQAVIDHMDAEQLRHYLNELISDNLTVGLEILKNS